MRLALSGHVKTRSVGVGELTKVDQLKERLPEMSSGDRRLILKLLEKYYAAAEQHEWAYWEVAECLDHVRETGVYHYWGTLEKAWKELFGISRARGYQLLEAREVYLLAPTIVDKCQLKNESICREVAKVETEQQRADVIAGIGKVCEVDGTEPTASLARRVRQELFPSNSKADPIEKLLASVDALRKRVEGLAEKHRPDSQSWDTALGHLEGMRQAFERLGK